MSLFFSLCVLLRAYMCVRMFYLIRLEKKYFKLTQGQSSSPFPPPKKKEKNRCMQAYAEVSKEEQEEI